MGLVTGRREAGNGPEATFRITLNGLWVKLNTRSKNANNGNSGTKTVSPGSRDGMGHNEHKHGFKITTGATSGQNSVSVRSAFRETVTKT
jgi:hypothetical protein